MTFKIIQSTKKPSILEYKIYEDNDGFDEIDWEFINDFDFTDIACKRNYKKMAETSQETGDSSYSQKKNTSNRFNNNDIVTAIITQQFQSNGCYFLL